MSKNDCYKAHGPNEPQNTEAFVDGAGTCPVRTPSLVTPAQLGTEWVLTLCRQMNDRQRGKLNRR